MTKFNLHWQVTHADGSRQTQDDCKYHELNRDTIVMIALCKKDGSILASIGCSKEEPFFYRRRVRQCENKILRILWMIGSPIELVGIFDNGQECYRDGFDLNDQWFYPVNFQEDEKWH